jgi:hypothetical protein
VGSKIEISQWWNNNNGFHYTSKSGESISFHLQFWYILCMNLGSVTGKYEESSDIFKKIDKIITSLVVK